jgi:hypothetical protein
LLVPASRRFRTLPKLLSERQNRILASAFAQAFPEEDEAESASAKKRRRHERRRAQNDQYLRKLDTEVLALSEYSGRIGTHIVSGLGRIGVGAAFEFLQFGYMFVVAMVTLYLAGAIYSGWTLTLSPDVEWWVLLTFISLAVAYITVVRSDINDQLVRMTLQLESLPFFSLLVTEAIVTTRSSVLMESDRASEFPEFWNKEILWRLDRLESERPTFP